MVHLQRWHGWCHMKLLPSGRVLCTPYNHAPCHFMQSHIRKVYVGVYSCIGCGSSYIGGGLVAQTGSSCTGGGLVAHARSSCTGGGA